MRISRHASLLIALLTLSSCSSNVTTETVGQSIDLSFEVEHSLPPGTHRPEILLGEEGDFYVIAVSPGEEVDGTTYKHLAYHYDAAWNLVGEPFPVTTITDDYGEPADHRAVLHDGEIDVVYQSLVWNEDAPEQGGIGGPMEVYAKNQSLMLSRFDLDGNLLFNGPIVANAESGSGDNFPDLSITWNGEYLFVSTGTGDNAFNLREVTLDGTVIGTHKYSVSTDGPFTSELGNSMTFDDEGLVMLTGNGPEVTNSLTITQLNSDFEVENSVQLPSTGREETFPTSVWYDDGYFFVGYISRTPNDSPVTDFVNNPYSPYLKILDTDFNVLSDTKVGQNGEMHVHPTVAVQGDTVYLAWSEDVSGKPQCRVEVYHFNPNK